MATFLIILSIIILIGICIILKRFITIEDKMVELHNHLVEGLDHLMREEAKHHSDTIETLDEALDHLNNILESAQTSRNAVHLKLDNLQKNWSDLKTGSIQVLTVK